MSGIKKTEGRFPCHLYEIRDAEEAYTAMDVALIRDYGKRLTLEDGFVLHNNYPDDRDEGGRYLTRCNVCGGWMLTQSSMEESPYWDDPDLYYRDCIPVASVEEADLLNILLDEKELKNDPVRHLKRDDLRILWTNQKAPAPNDPEELKKRIRIKYQALSPEHREMLEKKMEEAGKEEGETEHD